MTIDDTAVPRIPRGVRLSQDRARTRWVLLAPERILELDETAQAILLLCDGVRDVRGISEELAKTYHAGTPEIMADVKEMLGDLAAKHFVVL
ncbi:pyrroloquinoline quinone biosynthesis peptide chaperone PqqD [soil metagenome]